MTARLPTDVSLPLCAPLSRFVAALLCDGRLWLVGGAVRDLLDGKPACDIDLLTSVSAPAMVQLAEQMGLVVAWQHAAYKHGIVRIVAAKAKAFVDIKALAQSSLPQDEPALLRLLEADLVRRDLTINAMALPLHADGLLNLHELVDPLDGRLDLQNKIIRPCGHLALRLEEDPLRVLRIARFLTQGLAWQLCDADPDVVERFVPTMIACAAERKSVELKRALLAPCAHRLIECLSHWGALGALGTPQDATDSEVQDAIALLRRHQESLTTLVSRLTLLAFAFVGKRREIGDTAAPIALATRLLGQTVCEQVARLVSALRLHNFSLYKKALARFWLQMGEPLRAEFTELVVHLKRSGHLQRRPVDAFLRRSKRLLGGRPIPTRQNLPVDGHTLQRTLALAPGPIIKHLLDELLVYGMVNKCITNEPRLLAYARRKLQHLKQT